MFSEKNIPKLIIISPIITGVLIALLTMYFFVKTQNKNFEEESIRVEKEFITKQKVLLKKEIDSVLNYLTHQETLYSNKAIEKVIKKVHVLSTRLNQLYSDLNVEVNSKKQKEILTNLVNQKLSNNSYFFAYDISSNKIIQPINKDIKSEFYNDSKFFDNYLFSEEGKLIAFENSNKIVYVKYLPKLNWIIGNIENIHSDIAFIKDVALKYISSINFSNSGYVWVYDTNNKLLTKEKNYDKNENNLFSIEESKKKIIEDLVNSALNNEIGKYVKYAWKKPREKIYSNKIGYVHLFEKWNWVIGSSLFLDDIQESILKNKKNLELKNKEYIEYIILISLFVVLIIGVISTIMSNKISDTFKSYQKKVEAKEENLNFLNKELKNKVKVGIQEAQIKDRAMLHQSRLARLGTMISMIAHQWRQPLTEVSSILMELETAAKFKKADNKLIFECTKDSDRLLKYMSHTIDDFRNFFKPDKKEVDFSLQNSCFEALSIVDASLKDLNIKINKYFKEDTIIKGYPREFAQVLLNIFLNCKDAFIEKRVLNAFINITIEKKNNNAVILIEDNAGGIKQDNIDMIFEPYFTTKSSAKGTGLGLYMSKMIIEKNMNGILEAKNTKDGVVFEINIKGAV